MQDSRASSTLELVVDERQMQNMSRIDLNRRENIQNQSQNELPEPGVFSFKAIKGWPGRFRDDLGAKLDEAKAKSETTTQYVIELIRTFSSLIIWLLCFIGTIIVPIILLIIGLLNLDACPASPSLPFYVFTIGFVMTASNLFNLALAIDLPILANHRLLASDIKSIIASILNISFNTVVAFVYILTAYKVLTFGTQQAIDSAVEAEPTASPVPACNESLHSVAFWFIVITLSLFFLISTLGATLFAYNRYRLAIIRGSAPRSHPHQADLGGSQANMSPHVTTTNRL